MADDLDLTALAPITSRVKGNLAPPVALNIEPGHRPEGSPGRQVDTPQPSSRPGGIVSNPSRWWDEARCAGSTADFFPERAADAAPAKAVCAACPVRATCLAAHLHETHGIWGGLTATDLKRLRRVRAQLALDGDPVDIARDVRSLLDAGLPGSLLAQLAQIDVEDLNDRAGIAA